MPLFGIGIRDARLEREAPCGRMTTEVRVNGETQLKQLLERYALRRMGRYFLLLTLCLTSACREKSSAPNPGRASASSKAWFTDITQEVGLDFVHETGATGALLSPEIMAGGAAFLDFDNDGDLDIYLTNGTFGPDHTDTTDSPVNRLYRQEADGRFVDVTEASGLGDRGYGMGVAVGDIDNDGDVDVYVTNYGPDRLYRNNGNGTFKDVTAEARIDVDGWSASASFFDYDRDGFLDLYVTRYVDYDPSQKCFDRTGRPEYCGPKEFPGVPDVLLHNNGNGTFSNVSQAAGMLSVASAGLGVVCADLNEDGWTDVYVANDADANQLWINQGDGTFHDEALIMGVAYNMHGQAEAGMGVAAADFDGDGHPDLFMTHLGNESNTLYRNLGKNIGFDDVTYMAGLGRSSMAYTGFGIAAFDAELDGDLDILVVNGRVNNGKPIPGNKLGPLWEQYPEPNLFYTNDGACRYKLVEQPVFALRTVLEISRGLAIGDIDFDGDIDLLVTNTQGPARLYRNDMPRKGHWLIVRAVDPRLRRDAIGARVTVYYGDQRVVRTINPGFSYLSSSDPRAFFGLGNSTRVDRIVIRWPDGLRERFGGTPVDRALRLVRGSGEPET